jgi:hypothetical protein
MRTGTTVLIITIIITSVVAWESWLDHKLHIKKIEVQAAIERERSKQRKAIYDMLNQIAETRLRQNQITGKR